jgi:hypothetical protein
MVIPQVAIDSAPCKFERRNSPGSPNIAALLCSIAYPIHGSVSAPAPKVDSKPTLKAGKPFYPQLNPSLEVYIPTYFVAAAPSASGFKKAKLLAYAFAASPVCLIASIIAI